MPIGLEFFLSLRIQKVRVQEEVEVGLYDLIKAVAMNQEVKADKLANKLNDAGIDNALIGRLKDECLI